VKARRDVERDFMGYRGVGGVGGNVSRLAN
jgi:hypothetical protein